MARYSAQCDHNSSSTVSCMIHRRITGIMHSHMPVQMVLWKCLCYSDYQSKLCSGSKAIGVCLQFVFLFKLCTECRLDRNKDLNHYFYIFCYTSSSSASEAVVTTYERVSCRVSAGSEGKTFSLPPISTYCCVACHALTHIKRLLSVEFPWYFPTCLHTIIGIYQQSVRLIGW